MKYSLKAHIKLPRHVSLSNGGDGKGAYILVVKNQALPLASKAWVFTKKKSQQDSTPKRPKNKSDSIISKKIQCKHH